MLSLQLPEKSGFDHGCDEAVDHAIFDTEAVDVLTRAAKLAVEAVDDGADRVSVQRFEREGRRREGLRPVRVDKRLHFLHLRGAEHVVRYNVLGSYTEEP